MRIVIAFAVIAANIASEPSKRSFTDSGLDLDNSYEAVMSSKPIPKKLLAN